MSVALSSIRDADLARLARLHAECFPDDAWDASALGSVLAMPGAGGTIALGHGSEVCGLVLEQCLGEDAEILTLCVAPLWRRHGIARLLLGDSFTRAANTGVHHVVLEVAADNIAGLALYAGLGFDRQGRRRGYYRRADGTRIDAFRLALSLPAPS